MAWDNQGFVITDQREGCCGVGPGARPVRARRVPPGQAGPDAAWDQPWDVAVLGGGNAALVSALTAADNGARVLLLERAPAVFRGGNSRHTRNVRCAHEAADGYVTGPTRARNSAATWTAWAPARATRPSRT